MTPAVDPRVAHTRQLVIGATIAELTENGFERITLDAVAERSGVARSTIYRNWADRTALLVEAFDEMMSGSPADIEATDDLGSELHALAALLVANMTGEKWSCVVPSLISASLHDESLGDLMSSFGEARRREARTIFERAADRGEITRPAEIDSALERFIGPFFYRRMMARMPIDDAFVDRQVRATLDQLGAGTAVQ